MLVRELRNYIKHLSDDADIVMQSKTLVAPVLKARISKVSSKGKQYDRLILMNMKPLKKEVNKTQVK